MQVFSRHRRYFAHVGAALLGVAMLAGSASVLRAEDWPSRPIKIVVPFAPGGAVDLVARYLQSEMGPLLNATIVVENRPGGGGVPATEFLVRSPSDGYTLALVSASYTANAVLQPNLTYDSLKDITPIAKVITNTVLIVVPAESSIKTLADLIRETKNAKDRVTYGTPGYGSAMHFAGELFRVRADIDKLTHVPYNGAGPAMNDVLGNHLAVGILGIGPTIPHIRSGKLRALAITTDKRAANLPDVPTVAESGFPGYSSGEWFALIGPKNLPPEITKKLHDAAIKAISSPEIVAKLDNVGLEPTSSTPDELRDFLAVEITRLRDTADKARMLEQAK